MAFQFFFRASEANANILERIELSAARIITGLCNNCPDNIVLYDSDLPTFSIRKSYSLFDSVRIHFHTELLTKVRKGSDIPEFTRQIVIEKMHGIPHSALKIYTDSSFGDNGISGSCVHIETSGGPFDINIRRIVYISVFRFPPIIGQGHQHSLVDEIVFPSHPRHALLKKDLAIWLAKEVFDTVIESVEEGERKVDVAKAFEIPLSTLSTILKNKEKMSSASSSRVRKRVSKGYFSTS
ncbi:hypothetical protein TNCV_3624551 [Trichonephila clavipes]|nr:hypothetical protein TNCV_3624551 [Trichonephila clavipes]